MCLGPRETATASSDTWWSDCGNQLKTVTSPRWRSAAPELTLVPEPRNLPKRDHDNHDPSQQVTIEPSELWEICGINVHSVQAHQKRRKEHDRCQCCKPVTGACLFAVQVVREAVLRRA